MVGMARTGSGKTAAFVIPILQKYRICSSKKAKPVWHFADVRLKGHSTTVGARSLMIAPSRELALQTYAVALKLAKGMELRVAVVVGGDALAEQFMQIAANPDIVLATPGRPISSTHPT